jgi:hypothetical protein
MPLSRILRVLSWICGGLLIAWALADPGFRDAEGFLEGRFCLPLSLCIALIILGFTLKGRWKKFGFWFALALTGQAVALQLIEAGPQIRYQHYLPLYRMLRGTEFWYLVFILMQTGLVFSCLLSRLPVIKRWLTHHFKTWQLLCIGLVFLFSGATVSRNINFYFFELLFAVFVQAVNLGNIVLMVWALPDDLPASLKQKIGKVLAPVFKADQDQSIGVDRLAVFTALWVTSIAVFLNVVIYECHPHVPDEAIYLFQAKYFANGSLTVPAPNVPEAFSFYMIPHRAARWYSIFPPGWPAVLALGVILGVPWLINPLLAGLNTLLAYLFLQEIFPRRTARMGLLLLATSPWYIFMGMSFMSHTFTLTCALIAVLAMSRAKRSGKARWGWLGGVAVGMLSLTRPLDGLIMAGVLGLWSLGVVGRRLKTSSIMAFVIGTILVGAVIFPYNKQITGKSILSPLAAYYEEYFGPKANALGFGPERGLGWAIDPFPGHSPVDAIVNVNLNTFAINIELFGWSTGSLIIIAFLLFSKNMQKRDYLMLAIILVISATYSLYWFSGGPDFGARYWYLMLVPLIGLTVGGIRMLQEKFDFGGNRSSVHSTRLIAAVMSLIFMSLINFIPWRAIDKYHHYRGMRPDIRQLAKKHHFGKSMVLIRGDYSDYQSAWAYNPIDPEADAPIYAWDRNFDIRTQLIKAYPDRPVWVIEGPSVTTTGFEVQKGPLFAAELLIERNRTTYDLSFSTYMGGSDWEHARDVFADSQGNIYVVGGTASSDFPTTPGAYDTTFDRGFTGSFGPCDAFVCKLGPDGSLIWSTLLGGSGYDRAYAVEVDDSGYVYIAGRAGPGFPVKNGFQPTFKGVDGGPYGMQNAFVAKIRPDGSDLVWSSYVGVAPLCRDLAIDKKGDVYVPGGRWNTDRTPPSGWFANAFQKNAPGGPSDSGVIKIKGDGSRIIWATWLGGSGRDTVEASIRVDDKGFVYIATCTNSIDIPTTSGSHDTSFNGGVDLYLAKLTPDGSELVYGTYIGDSGENWHNTHNLAVDNQGNAYISVCATKSSFPVTPGAFQTAITGGIDWGIAKFSPTGSLISSTLIGGNSYDNPDGIYVDDSGNVFITGETTSSDFPGVNSNSYQSQNNGGHDAVFVILSSNFKELLYSTYIGGNANDGARSGFLSDDGSLCISGASDGNGWPTKKAFQRSFNGGKYDVIVAKFDLQTLVSSLSSKFGDISNIQP